MLTCRLNVLLAERGIKKKDFAASIGVSAGALSNWCNNKSQPELEQAYRVAEVLGISVMDVWVRES